MSESEIERIALGIMLTSTREIRRKGIDIGKNGSPESLKVCNSIYLNAKKILMRSILDEK